MRNLFEWFFRLWLILVVIFSLLSVLGGVQTLVADTYANPLLKISIGLGTIINGLIVGISYLLLIPLHRWSRWTVICYIVSQIIIPTIAGTWVAVWTANRPDITALSTKVTAVVGIAIIAIFFYGLLIAAVVLRKKY